MYRLESTEVLSGIDDIEPDDKSRIEAKIGNDPSGFFKVDTEYSPTKRATCVSCHEKIPRNAIRVGKLDAEPDVISEYSKPIFRYKHLECFSSSRDESGFRDSGDHLYGYDQLSPEDKEKVLAELP